jgi:hypothetical protein
MSTTVVTPGEFLGSYLTAMSWTEFTLVGALGICLMAWLLVPFSLIGVRSRLEELTQTTRDMAQITLTETRQTHEILRDIRGGMRDIQFRMELVEEAAQPTATEAREELVPIEEIKRAA